MATSERRRPTPRKAPTKRSSGEQAPMKVGGSSKTSASTPSFLNSRRTNAISARARTSLTDRSPQKTPRTGKRMDISKLRESFSSRMPRAKSKNAARDRSALSSSRARSRGERTSQANPLHFILSTVAHTLGKHIILTLATLAFLVVCGWVILTTFPIFVIQHVTADAGEHVSAADIVQLAHVDEGSTLFNFNADAISQRLKKSPWIANVHIERRFPDTLHLSVEENKVDVLASIGTSNIVWCLSKKGIWIEPMSLEADDTISLKERVIKKAQELGALAITDLPSSVNPEAGYPATDDVLAQVATYRQEFSSAFLSKIASFSAPSPESISLTLTSGIEVSVGRSTEVTTKEQVITKIIEKNEGKITYINARIPQKPSYRMVNSENVQPGTGV